MKSVIFVVIALCVTLSLASNPFAEWSENQKLQKHIARSAQRVQASTDFGARVEHLIGTVRRVAKRVALQTPPPSTVKPATSTSTATPPPTNPDISPECVTAMSSPDLGTCTSSLSLDVTQQSPAQIESKLCTAKTGCIDILSNAFTVCKSVFQQMDAQQPAGSPSVFAQLMLLLNGFRSLCPTTPGGSDGCFASLTTLTTTTNNIGSSATQDQLKSFCDNSCANRIQKFLNLMMAAADGGNSNGPNPALKLHQLFCMQDNNGEYCYTRFIALAQSSSFDPKKMCPDLCVRRTFLAFADVASDNAASDFKKVINTLCAKNGENYCYDLLAKVTDFDLQGSAICSQNDEDKMRACLQTTKQIAGCSSAVSSGAPNPSMPCTCATAFSACLVKDVSSACLSATFNKDECKSSLTCTDACTALPEARKHCFDGNTCIATVAADAECKAFINANTETFAAGTPCTCIDKIVACHQTSVDAKCYDNPNAYIACRTMLKGTQCAAKCSAYKPKCYDLYGMSDSTGTCSADCKASLQSKFSTLGCCAGVAKNELGRLGGESSDLSDFDNLGKVLGLAKSACALTTDDKCADDGKVTGKLGIKNLSKSVVDANKQQIYSAVQKDLAQNAAVDTDKVTVTGHSATGARRAVLADGVTFDYTIATEDSASAASLQNNLNAASNKGTLDISSTTAAAAVADPSANIAVDSTASTADDGSTKPTVSSSAASVAASVFALVALCVALAF